MAGVSAPHFSIAGARRKAVSQASQVVRCAVAGIAVGGNDVQSWGRFVKKEGD